MALLLPPKPGFSTTGGDALRGHGSGFFKKTVEKKLKKVMKTFSKSSDHHCPFTRQKMDHAQYCILVCVIECEV